MPSITKPSLRRLWSLVPLWLLFIAAPLRAAELKVFAAASLSDAFTELAPLYARASGDTLIFNFASSGTLARQVQEGAPADMIFSADEQRLDQLAKAGLLLANTRRTLLANTLVMVIAKDHPKRGNFKSLADLRQPTIQRIALGLPASVPAGTYAQAHLKNQNLWEPLQSKFVFVDNVRAVLASVEAGNADAGFVYKTDALSSKKVVIALEIPRNEGPAITYPAAVLKDSKSADAARNLVNWLSGEVARGVFVRHGFLPAAP